MKILLSKQFKIFVVQSCRIAENQISATVLRFVKDTIE